MLTSACTQGNKMTSDRSLGSGSVCPARKTGVLRFYSNRVCPFAKRTRMVLEYKNIPYETININLADKPKWYIENVNCLGAVPAIESDDSIVFDSVIINEYLDATYPEKKLIPSGAYQAAKDKMLAEIWSKVLRQTGRIYMCPAGTEVEVIPDLLEALDYIEKAVSSRTGPFLGGSSPMMIDFHIWPHMERIIHYSEMYDNCKIDNTRYPCLTSWIKQMTNLPEVMKTSTPVKTFRMFLATVKAGKTDYDVGLDE